MLINLGLLHPPPPVLRRNPVRAADGPLRVSAQVLSEDRSKQAFCLPVTSREQFVIGAPIPIGPTQTANRSGDGPSTHNHRQRQGVFNRSSLGAFLRKDILPSFLQQAGVGLQQHVYLPNSISPNTFLSVRTKRLRRWTFLINAEAKDSRSTCRPWTCSMRAMISETCKGALARLSCHMPYLLETYLYSKGLA